MHRALSPMILMLLPALALAQEETAHAPSPTVDMIYVVIFILLFFGGIGGFFIYLWMNERKKKQEQ